ncbi:hypothetical protein BDN72DRAFT_724233, partial [Pluteus cervinus]
PSSWRLVKQGEGEGEEVVFTLQGVIEEKNLPPMVEDPNFRIPRNKAQYLTQSVTISGLGTSTFEDSITALNEMYTVFSRQFPEGRLMPLQSNSSNWGLGRSLVLSNRYFTKRSEGPQMKSVPFPAAVDPRKILTRYLTSSLIHTEENDVQYFVLLTVIRYHSSTPQNFRVGDIVEVQFSLVVYQMRTEHYVLKPMLYSLALLDAKYANVTQPSSRPLKRKVGYKVEEDV